LPSINATFRLSMPLNGVKGFETILHLFNGILLKTIGQTPQDQTLGPMTNLVKTPEQIVHIATFPVVLVSPHTFCPVSWGDGFRPSGGLILIGGLYVGESMKIGGVSPGPVLHQITGTLSFINVRVPIPTYLYRGSTSGQTAN